MGYSASSLSVNNKNRNISVPRGSSGSADAAKWVAGTLLGEPGSSHLSKRHRKAKFRKLLHDVLCSLIAMCPVRDGQTGSVHIVFNEFGRQTAHS